MAWLEIYALLNITTLHAAIGFTIHTKSFGFSKFLKFHKFLHQYQACLYLFECISHGDSKYSHKIPKCFHFLNILWHLLTSSAHACRVERVMKKANVLRFGMYFSLYHHPIVKNVKSYVHFSNSLLRKVLAIYHIKECNFITFES